VGGGFGGLRVARGLRRAPVDVTVVDRHNYHTFVPLLYQVATAGLEPEEIAQPIRRVLRGAANARFRLARVTAVDVERRVVTTDLGALPYDYLVVAAGSATNYFGLESVARTAAALRDLDDAESLRDRMLVSFELASGDVDEGRRRRLMTVVVGGGGPTGVELAGAMAEFRRHVLPRDHPELDWRESRVVLLEAAERILPAMPDSLQRRAQEHLRSLGVELRLGAAIADADEEGVTLQGGEHIGAGLVVWVAGLQAPLLADRLSGGKGAGGRVVVTEALQLPEHPEVYVIGDMAHVGGPEARPHPMLAPVAIQQGDLAAENILRAVRGQPPRPFSYKDRGTMVTIGRSRAVAVVFGLRISGFPAWLLWLGVHLVWLVGLRNRALVLVNWVWNYLTYDRAVRMIRQRRAGAGGKGREDERQP
jgi:NADH dehydrogenase